MKVFRQGCGRAALALAVSLAACQPLPHPFEDDRPPADLLRIADGPGIAIASIEGKPSATAAKLGTEVARSLLKREIPASEKTTSLGSYQLYGRVVQAKPRRGKAAVTAYWRLYNAAGKTIGERTVKVEAKPRDWDTGAAGPVQRLAASSAEAIATLLTDEPPLAEKGTAQTAEPSSRANTGKAAAAPAVAKKLDEGRIRIAIRKVSGAPGDGSKSLANAVGSVLKRQNLLAIVDGSKDADLYVEAEVTITPVKPDKQHVKIVWRVKRADGAEIGTVGQENDVPKGLLDGPWGDVAYSVAIAAGDGLLQLVARGAPERRS